MVPWKTSSCVCLSEAPQKLIFKTENASSDCDHFEGFEKYVRWQLTEVIPVCYFEGYKNLVGTMEKLAWPKKPKFIFASNAFDTEEIFKVWAASKVEKDVPLEGRRMSMILNSK